MVELVNISKSYGSTRALKSVTLKLENGIHALLGPNGAGKTTLMKIMVGIMESTSGQVLYNGKKIKCCEKEYLGKLGYLPQTPVFYPSFTGTSFLNYMAELKKVPKSVASGRIARLLDMLNLKDVSNKRISTYSGGMKQRLGIAQALINDPEILILDEPTAGLDPKERIRFRNLLLQLSKDKIILLSTHIVTDVEHLATKIILIRDGEIVSATSPTALLREVSSKVWQVPSEDNDIQKLMSGYNVSSSTYDGERFYLRVISDKKPSLSAEHALPTMEDVYINCFGEKG